jgi:hypothetical protein
MTSTLLYSDASGLTINDAIKATYNTATIKIYDGSQPASPETSISTQNLLATLTLPSTAFGTTTSSGTHPSRSASAAASAITDVNASATGVAAWFRAVRSDGTTPICDGSVGLSGADLNLTDLSLTSGEAVHVSSINCATPQ